MRECEALPKRDLTLNGEPFIKGKCYLAVMEEDRLTLLSDSGTAYSFTDDIMDNFWKDFKLRIAPKSVDYFDVDTWKDTSIQIPQRHLEILCDVLGDYIQISTACL